VPIGSFGGAWRTARMGAWAAPCNNTMHMGQAMDLGPSAGPEAAGQLNYTTGNVCARWEPRGGLAAPEGFEFVSRCFDGEPHTSIACASRQQPQHIADARTHARTHERTHARTHVLGFGVWGLGFGVWGLGPPNSNTMAQIAAPKECGFRV
jgi:hypothetical protein